MTSGMGRGWRLRGRSRLLLPSSECVCRYVMFVYICVSCLYVPAYMRGLVFVLLCICMCLCVSVYGYVWSLLCVPMCVCVYPCMRWGTKTQPLLCFPVTYQEPCIRDHSPPPQRGQNFVFSLPMGNYYYFMDNPISFLLNFSLTQTFISHHWAQGPWAPQGNRPAASKGTQVGEVLGCWGGGAPGVALEEH